MDTDRLLSGVDPVWNTAIVMPGLPGTASRAPRSVIQGSRAAVGARQGLLPDGGTGPPTLYSVVGRDSFPGVNSCEVCLRAAVPQPHDTRLRCHASMR